MRIPITGPSGGLGTATMTALVPALVDWLTRRLARGPSGARRNADKAGAAGLAGQGSDAGRRCPGARTSMMENATKTTRARSR